MKHAMKKTALHLTALAVLAGYATAGHSGEWVSLFDGKSLDG